MTIAPPLDDVCRRELVNGVARPTNRPNAWVADFRDPAPTLCAALGPAADHCRRIELGFDCDFDHPLESVLMGHPERVLPFCVRHYRICDGTGKVLAECADNHQTHNTIRLASAITTDQLVIECLETHGETPPVMTELHCYAC